MNGEQDKISVTVTLPEDLVKEVDARAAELDLNRSQYFRRLVRAEIKSTAKKPEEQAVAA